MSTVALISSLTLNNCVRLSQSGLKSQVVRAYSYGCSCPPQKPPGCPCPCPPPKKPSPGGSQRVLPPSECQPGPIPPNPCCPVFHHGKDTWKKYRMIVFFVCFPLIFIQGYNISGIHPPHKTECRDYEYMRIRTKRFPWGDGVKTFFHNDEVNFLPGECEPAPLDCD